MSITEDKQLPLWEGQESFDFSEEDTTNEGEEITLAKLAKLAEEQERLEGLVADKMKELKEAQLQLADISEKRLPELMDELELKTFETSEGLKINIKETMRASITQSKPEQQQEAFTWLEDHGHGHLIKREFKIEFGKSENKWADKFERDLAKRKKPLRATRKMSVHSGSLAAFLAEELAKGVDVPLEIFNGFRQQYTKIERKK